MYRCAICRTLAYCLFLRSCCNALKVASDRPRQQLRTKLRTTSSVASNRCSALSLLVSVTLSTEEDEEEEDDEEVVVVEEKESLLVEDEKEDEGV